MKLVLFLSSIAAQEVISSFDSSFGLYNGYICSLYVNERGIFLAVSDSEISRVEYRDHVNSTFLRSFVEDHTVTPNRINSLASSDTYLFSGGMFQDISYQWNINTGELVRKLYPVLATSKVENVCIQDGFLIATDTRAIRKYDVSTAEIKKEITVDSNIRITSALCHPNYVFIGTYDGQIFEYNLKTSYPPVKYHHHTEPHTKPITCLAYTGNYVFSAAGDKVIKQWSLGGKIVRSMYACPHCPHYVLAAQNYFFYIQGPDNKAFVMVDAVHGEHLYKMKAADDISAVYIYGNNLYIGHMIGKVEVWEIPHLVPAKKISTLSSIKVTPVPPNPSTTPNNNSSTSKTILDIIGIIILIGSVFALYKIYHYVISAQHTFIRLEDRENDEDEHDDAKGSKLSMIRESTEMMNADK